MVGKTTDYSKMKVTDLKELLAERSLSQSGAKAALVARLQADDKQKTKKGSTRSRTTKKSKAESEEDSQEEEEKPKKGKKPAKKTTKKSKAVSEDEESEEEKPKAKKPAKKNTKKSKASTEESQEEEDSQEQEEKKPKRSTKGKKSKAASEDSQEDSQKEKTKKTTRKSKVVSEESESEEKPKGKPSKKSKAVSEDSQESSEERPKKGKRSDTKKSKAVSEASSDESSISEKPVKVKFPKGVSIPDTVYKIPAESLFRIFVKANEESLEMKDMLNTMITALEPYSGVAGADDDAPSPQEEAKDGEDGADKVDLVVTWDEKLKAHTDSEKRWAFDKETKKVFGKVKDAKKIVPLEQDDIESLQDPPIDNLGVLSKEKFSEVLGRQILEAPTDTDDDGKDVVQKVEEEVKKMLDAPIEIDEATFIDFATAQENVKEKADYMAIAKEAEMEEATARYIMTNFVTLKEKFAKALAALKTKKAEGRKVRRK
jgi:hypothetical protein